MNSLQLGPFNDHPTTGILVKDGQQQVLRHQVNLLLKTFVKRQGELLSKEESGLTNTWIPIRFFNV